MTYQEGRSPVLKNPDGTVSTHSMAYGEADGKYYVYPTVVMGGGDKLQRLSGDDAWNNAMQTENYIEFGSEKDAEWFSKNYKKYWDK